MLNSIWRMLLMLLVAEAVANSRMATPNCKELENHTSLLKRNKGICFVTQAYLRAAFSKTGQCTSTSSLLTLRTLCCYPSLLPNREDGFVIIICMQAILTSFWFLHWRFYSFFICPVHCKWGIQKVEIHIQNLLMSIWVPPCCLWSSLCVTLAEEKGRMQLLFEALLLHVRYPIRDSAWFPV